MKTAEPGDYLEWKGRLYRCIGVNPGDKAIQMESLDYDICPNCGKDTVKNKLSIIERSPLFQENANPVSTLIINK